MSVIENIDVVMGARTEQMDAAIAKEIKNMEALKASISGMSTAGAALSPVAANIASAVSAYSTSIPGLSAGLAIFASSAAAIRAAYAKKNDDVEKLANAMDRLKRKASEAKNEVASVAKPTALMDPRGANVTAALSGGSMLGDLMLGGGSPFSGRSVAEQKAYEAAIDSSLAKTATYKSTWKDTGAAMQGATGLGIVGVGALATGVGLAVAGVAGLAHVSGEVSKQMNEIDQTADAAKRLGMTFSEIETLRFTNQFAGGMDPASTDAAVQKMMMNLAEAAETGTGPVRDKLAALGLDAGRLLQVGPLEAIKQISAKTSELKNPTEQLKVAYDLFGKSGTAMVETLRGGPAEIAKMEKLARELGLTLTQAQTEQVGAANDSWDKVRAMATGTYRQIAAEVAPALQVLADSVLEVGMGFKGWSDNLKETVTTVTYLSGAMADVYELTNLRSAMLGARSKEEGWKIAQDAFDFSGGQKAVEKLMKAREAAENKATAPKHNEEATLAVANAAEEAARKEQETRQKLEADARKAMEDKSKKYDEIASSIQREADAIKAANDLRAQGLKVNEADLKLIQEANGLTAGTGGEYVAKLLQEKRLQEGIKNDLEEAERIKRDSVSEDQKALDRATELKRLKSAGMIDERTFNAAMMKNAKESMGEPTQYRGAASAQAGSVEAYKLLLERDKGAINEARKQTAAAERMADILEKLQGQFDASPVIRAAR